MHMGLLPQPKLLEPNRTCRWQLPYRMAVINHFHICQTPCVPQVSLLPLSTKVHLADSQDRPILVSYNVRHGLVIMGES